LKFLVWKKRFFSVTFHFVSLNIVFLSLLVFLITHGQPLQIALSVITISFNVLAFSILRHEGSIISFDENCVDCMFLGITRKSISYSEIQDYGTFFYRTINQGSSKFIVISRVKLTEIDKMDVYNLYRKTDDVIVVEYRIEILKLLKANVLSTVMPYSQSQGQ